MIVHVSVKKHPTKSSIVVIQAPGGCIINAISFCQLLDRRTDKDRGSHTLHRDRYRRLSTTPGLPRQVPDFRASSIAPLQSIGVAVIGQHKVIRIPKLERGNRGPAFKVKSAIIVSSDRKLAPRGS